MGGMGGMEGVWFRYDSTGDSDSTHTTCTCIYVPHTYSTMSCSTTYMGYPMLEVVERTLVEHNSTVLFITFL